MQIVACEQGTAEWHEARLGIPTASCFGKIVTSTGTASKQAADYMDELLGEWLTGASKDGYTSTWMARGTELEPDGRLWYEFAHDVTVQQVGFVMRDNGLVGGSPDGLVGDDGGLEIKCPAPGTHIGYLRTGKIPAKYVPQVQGGMWVCDRQWWNFVSYHPSIEPLVVRVQRDEKFVDSLSALVGRFVEKMLEEREKLITKGYHPKCQTTITSV